MKDYTIKFPALWVEFGKWLRKETIDGRWLDANRLVYLFELFYEGHDAFIDGSATPRRWVDVPPYLLALRDMSLI